MRVYIYLESWFEDCETYGTNIVYVGDSLLPDVPVLFDTVEVWENGKFKERYYETLSGLVKEGM